MAAMFTTMMLIGIISLGACLCRSNRQAIERIINNIFEPYEYER